MNKQKISNGLAIFGMIIIAIIFSVMPTVQILGVNLIPVRIPPQVIDVETEAGIVQFDIPSLDLREYSVNHFQIEQWFLERINSHRENASLPHFFLNTQATATSIEHSIDMRDHRFLEVYASDGRTEEERYRRWFGSESTREKATVILYFTLEGEFDQHIVKLIADHLFVDGERTSTLLDPNYRYIGIGISVDKNGCGYLTITLIG